MGSMLLSECKCGFQSDSLSVGGGMMDFGSKCWTPFSCSKCKSVGTINILTKEGKKGRFRCPKCRKKVEYYGEVKEDTFEVDDISYVFDWKVGEFDRYYLKDKSYQCPKCKSEDLKFQSVGNWD